MLSADFEPILMKIGRIELELSKFKKWTHKKKHAVNHILYNIYYINIYYSSYIIRSGQNYSGKFKPISPPNYPN